MPVAPETRNQPCRQALGPRNPCWRRLGIAAGLAIAAGAALASWPAVALVLAATLCAMLLEQRGARTQATGSQPASLEMSHERMRSVLEALAEGVLVVDSAGVIVLANPAAQRAMQVPAQDPTGRLLWDALKPELTPRARDAWETLHRGAPVGALSQVRHAGVPCRDRVYDLTAVGVTSARTGQDFGTVLLLVDSTRAHELQRLKDRFLSNV